jgi:hypothetical protein
LPIWRLSDRLMNAEPVDFNLPRTQRQTDADRVAARFEEAEREADERRAKPNLSPAEALAMVVVGTGGDIWHFWVP